MYINESINSKRQFLLHPSDKNNLLYNVFVHRLVTLIDNVIITYL